MYSLFPPEYHLFLLHCLSYNILDDATESEYKDLASEIKVLIYIGKHCNIVNLLGACTRNGSLFSIMEYCPYGNLKSFLKSKRDCYSSQWCTTLHELSESLTLGDLASIIYQIARGLEFLHSKEVCYAFYAICQWRKNFEIRNEECRNKPNLHM